MIIQLHTPVQKDNLSALKHILDNVKISYYLVETNRGMYMICTPKKEFDIRKIGRMKGVKDVHRVSGNHKLVSNKWKVDRTIVHIGNGTSIGGEDFQVMAGPCSIENADQVENTIDALLESNVRIMRGGVYKPRTSPYSFRGLGMEGLQMWYKQCQKNGMHIITEVMETGQIDEMYPFVDIYQVGARNSQNFNLLEALGAVDKPVLLKRGISGSIDELLYSAEYIFKAGNEKIILCERGIRTYETASRNTLDLNAVPILQQKSHLPVVVDPSHGIGLREHVSSMALAGVAAGADGIIMEIHQTPHTALTDSRQTIDFPTFHELVEKINSLRMLLV